MIDTDLSIGGSLPVVQRWAPPGSAFPDFIEQYPTLPPDGIGEVFPYGYHVEPPN